MQGLQGVTSGWCLYFPKSLVPSVRLGTSISIAVLNWCDHRSFAAISVRFVFHMRCMLLDQIIPFSTSGAFHIAFRTLQASAPTAGILAVLNSLQRRLAQGEIRLGPIA